MQIPVERYSPFSIFLGFHKHDLFADNFIVIIQQVHRASKPYKIFPASSTFD